MRKKIILPFMLASITIIAGCEKQAAQQQQEAPPLAVKTAKPLVKETIDWNEFTGRVEPLETVEVRSRVSGYITDIYFKDGEIVEQGQLLFTIDPRPYEAEVKRTAGELESRRAQYKLASLEFERAQTLQNKNVIATEEYDTKRNDLTQALAAVHSAEGTLETAQLNLEFCQIKAPIKGKASRALITKGNLIQPNSQILTTIIRQDPTAVYFDIGENLLLNLNKVYNSAEWKQRSQETSITVELGLGDDKGYPYKGKLDFTENRLDSNTGTMRARAIFDNEKNILLPGLFARVRIPASLPYKAVLIPETAIGTEQGNKFVITVNDKNEAVNTAIETGPMAYGLRIVKSGLSANDTVVLNGLQMIRPNAKLAPEPSEITAKTVAADADTTGSQE